MSTRATETGQPGGNHNSEIQNFPANARPEETERQDGPQGAEAPVHLWEEEQKVLEQTVAELRAEQQQFLERYIGLEEQNSALTSLYVACQSLHSSLDRPQILLTARE